jgi:arsenate reductase
MSKERQDKMPSKPLPSKIPELKVYEYSNCSTCKKALKFLEARNVPYEKIGIVDQPPGIGELRQMLKHLGGDMRKLFNTSGQVYREMGLSAKLGSLTEAEALKLLSSNGKLIKRPFALGTQSGAVGFQEAEWKKKFLSV